MNEREEAELKENVRGALNELANDISAVVVDLSNALSKAQRLLDVVGDSRVTQAPQNTSCDTDYGYRIKSGKHAGRTLAWIAQNDPKLFSFLKTKHGQPGMPLYEHLRRLEPVQPDPVDDGPSFADDDADDQLSYMDRDHGEELYDCD